MMLQSRFSIGIACNRSSAFPCGTPSTTSSSTTSASSFAAIQCAAVAPTLPEPTIVTFFRIFSPSRIAKSLISILESPQNPCAQYRPERANTAPNSSQTKWGQPIQQDRPRLPLHIFNHACSKLARLHLRRALHSTLEVVGDKLLPNRLLHRAFDQPSCFRPTQKIKQHHS